MPTPYIKKMSEETGLSVAQLESYWDKAKEIALKEYKETDENFYGYVVGIFKNMIGAKESINESTLVNLVDSFFDYVCEEGELSNVSTTQSADIAKPDKMLFGKPLFRVSNDMFHKIGFENRKKFGWNQKFYGTKVGEWARTNKGKGFTIENEDTGWLIDVDRDRFDKYGKEITIDNESRKRKTNR